MSKRIKWSLIGIPDDQGIFNVGGRLGASQGPSSFRNVFSRISGYPEIIQSGRDLGDVPITSSIHQNHIEASNWIRDAQRDSERTIVVGGGHDHGYSQLLGIYSLAQETKKTAKIGCINIDAHLDVRIPEPLPNSGSPFYLALEAGIIDGKNLIEFGIQNHCNGPDLWKYVKSKKIIVDKLESLTTGKRVEAFKKHLSQLSKRVDQIVISLDLDALSESHCPGVSAPQADGFSATEVFEMIRIASKNKKVVSLGIFELSPILDRSEQTARVAVGAAFQFITR